MATYPLERWPLAGVASAGTVQPPQDRLCRLCLILQCVSYRIMFRVLSRRSARAVLKGCPRW